MPKSYKAHGVYAAQRAIDLSKRGAKCPKAPVLMTNVIDKEGEFWEAALVYPDRSRKGHCSIYRACTDTPCESISLDSMGIESVIDIPPTTTELLLGYNNLDSLNLTMLPEDGVLSTVNINTNNITSMDDILLPASVRKLNLVNNHITELKFSHHLGNVVTLDISGNPIISVVVEESGLTDLKATSIPLPSLGDLALPSSITMLDVSWNPNMTFANFTAPHDLVTFLARQANITELRSIDLSAASGLKSALLEWNPIESIVGVQFPPTISRLHLNDSAISCFVIRESDVKTLERLRSFNVTAISQTSCSPVDADGAKTQRVKIGRRSFPFSVLDDETFSSRFFPSNSTEPAKTPTPSPRTPSPTLAPTPTPTAPQNGDGHLAASMAVALLVIAFVGVGALVLWTCYLRRKFSADTDDIEVVDAAKEEAHNVSSSTVLTTSNDSSILSKDVREDPLVQAKRLSHSEVESLEELGRGAFGVVYLARLSATGALVVVKRLRQEKAKDPDAIRTFMAEIKLAARLEHPNLVQCLGVAWSTLTDLTIVMEYMANGDLASVLAKQHHHAGSDWSWASSSTEVTAGPQKSKLQIAVDVASALAYLHGLDSPVIHRDIKAANVLVSEDWVAKLGDFGVSRTVGTQMTAEVGTVAWTAPEVLKGGKYNAAADVFSFGVLLSELDTGEKPYANGIRLGSDSNSLETNGSGSLALAVTEKGARPAFRSDCPGLILAIAMACLDHEPEQRPTASDLVERLTAAVAVMDEPEQDDKLTSFTM